MKVRGGRITKPKYITWWMFAVVAFLIFVLLQIPAAWLIAKFYKNNQVLHNVSGNIWHGQADWQTGKLRGTVLWTTRPLDLLLLRAGVNLEIYSANTKLEGVLAYGFGKKIMVRDLNGQIAPETLKSLANWQWPSNAIQLQEIDFNYKKEQGFDQVDGGIQWAGGELMYIFAQRPQQMQIPSLAGRLSQEQNKLMVDLRDQRQQKLMNLTIDPSLMLDVQLTQRLMLNVPSYQGKAGLDSYVVSSRQPLLSGGLLMGFDLQKLPELNLKQFERIAPLCLMLLILALCWKLAGLFWLWVAPPQVMQMPRVELGSQQPQVPNITNFALFAEQSKNPADDQLNLQLQGVVVGQPSQFSSAVIKANNVAERYRVGENIEGSAYYLSEVYWDRAILKNNSGQTRELFFQGIDNLDQQIVPPATAPVAAPAVSQEQQALGQAVQNLQQDREQYLKDLGVNTNNTGQGYQVTEQTPAALRSRLGLQAGDQIMSLNGQTIGQGQNDAQLLERARREGQVKIEVKRGDRIITVQQNFQ